MTPRPYDVCSCGNYAFDHRMQDDTSCVYCACTVFVPCSDAKKLSGPPPVLVPLNKDAFA